MIRLGATLVFGWISLGWAGGVAAFALYLLYERFRNRDVDLWSRISLGRASRVLSGAALSIPLLLMFAVPSTVAEHPVALELVSFMSERIPALNWPGVNAGPPLARLSLALGWLISPWAVVVGWLTCWETARRARWLADDGKDDRVFFRSVAGVFGSMAILYIGTFVPIGNVRPGEDFVVQALCFALLVRSSFKMAPAFLRMLKYVDDREATH